MTWKIKEKLKDRLATETGYVQKDPGGKLRVALVYPNEYEVGMGNLAVHSIYAAMNSDPQTACERAFLPGRRDLALHRKTRTPIITLESQSPLSDFDIVAFSISFENDFLNIIPILAQSKIPHRKEERSTSHPRLIAGGAAVTLNPRPVEGIFDEIHLGDFEAKEKSFVPDLNSFKTQTVIYSRGAAFSDMHLIECERGCPRNCKYCAAPVIYSPFRKRSFESIVAMVDDGIKYRNRFGLIGADILSHPDFVDIAEYIHKKGATFSPSSVRVDAVDEKRARLLEISGHRSIALGVEAGSERLRSSIGKKISDDEIIESVKILSHHGVERVKLYFMIGLPGEKESDTEAIAALAKKTLNAARRRKKEFSLGSIEIIVSPFVPKPDTAFADEEFAGEKYLKRVISELKRSIVEEDGLSLDIHSPSGASVENFFANSKRDCTDVLEEAFKSENVRNVFRLKR